jgi:hypothetical protein
MQISGTLAKRLLLACLASILYAGINPHALGEVAQTPDLSSVRLPLSFEQNVGQTDPQVRFLSRSGRYRVYLTDQAAVLQIAGAGDKNGGVVVRTTLAGSSESAHATGRGLQNAPTNYMVGPRESWNIGVANYTAVEYASVYPGINLVYYGSERQLEYDFDVAPHANAGAIVLNVAGANRITTSEDGSLVLDTAAGEVRWAKPVAYQQVASKRRLVNASYRVNGNLVSFDIGQYDHNKELIIDPILLYGTFLDGTNFDRPAGMLVDSAGYVYILGETSSTDFPTTPGAYQRQIQNSLNAQIFVSKLTQDFSALVWSTIIGGSGSNNYALPYAFALDQSENAYIVGTTADQYYDETTNQFIFYPSTFPTTSVAYNTDRPASVRYFLLKLNNTGSALNYSTFLSDQPNIDPTSVAVDEQGHAYITGIYNQNNGLTAPFPATAGAYQSTYAGYDDSFVMKFNPQASGLIYATLIGGSQTEDAYQIQVDSGGNATIDGFTYSSNYPITSNGMRQTDEGGFITTFNPQGTGLIYSTVLNHVMSIDVKRDDQGNYYASGSAGTNLPTTPTAFQRTFPPTGSGIHIGFVTEIDTSGNLVYSSYLAGNPPDGSSEDTEVQLVSPDQITIVGNRFSDSTFPVTDRTYEQENCSFLAKFNTRASGKNSLLYSGCTPVNMTDNLLIEQFRGIPLFAGANMHLDGENHLYALSAIGPTSSKAFEKKPPNQTSGDGYFVWVGKYDLSNPGPGVVSLSEPYYWGPPYTSPVVYRATSASPQCRDGIAAMRVYTSPGAIAYTTAGATLDANIAFPQDGQYSTVIVAYDNCGHAFTNTAPIFVQGTSSENPTVVSPTNGGVVTSRVHYVASAQAPACSSGIAAMRIYKAPNVAVYTVKGSSLDTYISLAPGSYNTVVQAWDNCGGVYKTPVGITVE